MDSIVPSEEAIGLRHAAAAIGIQLAKPVDLPGDTVRRTLSGLAFHGDRCLNKTKSPATAALRAAMSCTSDATAEGGLRCCNTAGCIVHATGLPAEVTQMLAAPVSADMLRALRHRKRWTDAEVLEVIRTVDLSGDQMILSEVQMSLSRVHMILSQWRVS